MSLKVFHIVFILVSVLLCFGFGIWLVFFSNWENTLMSILGGAMSIAIGFGLIVYGRNFLQKFKDVSNL